MIQLVNVNQVKVLLHTVSESFECCLGFFSWLEEIHNRKIMGEKVWGGGGGGGGGWEKEKRGGGVKKRGDGCGIMNPIFREHCYYHSPLFPFAAVKVFVFSSPYIITQMEEPWMDRKRFFLIYPLGYPHVQKIPSPPEFLQEDVARWDPAHVAPRAMMCYHGKDYRSKDFAKVPFLASLSWHT